MLWRIILSIVLGFGFPFVSLAILLYVELYLPRSLTMSSFYGEPAPGILYAPFTLPVYLDIFLKQTGLLPEMFDNFRFRMISLIVFDWLLYGTVFYVVLGRFKKLKTKTAAASDEPPPPPVF